MTGADSGEPAEAIFERIGAPYLARPEVTAGTGFGNNPGLRVDGRIFAMLVRGRLVVKLPAARVAESIERGTGERLEMGDGRRMREWLSVAVEGASDWPRLVEEAFAFVARGK